MHGFWSKLAALLAALLLSPSSFAFLPPPVGPTQNDFGGVGLLQTPTARFEALGEFNFGISDVWPYRRMFISVQPLDYLEATIRYVEIKNRLYGASIAGDQTYKDKGIDFKLRLWEESDLLPAAAIGMLDIGGTGLFASEYLVFSKRYYEWDFSLGLGWGYLGARGDFSNPLIQLDERFANRTNSVGEGGEVSFGSMFRGQRVGLFGGVSYQPRHSDWSYVVELDGNDYLNEPLGNSFVSSSAFNVGVSYRLSPVIEVGLGYERGDTLLLSFTLSVNLADYPAFPKLRDPDKPKVTLPQAPYRTHQPLASIDEPMINTMAERFANQQLRLEQLRLTDGQPEAVFNNSYYAKEPEAIGRAARLLVDSFPEASQVRLTRQVHGVDTYQLLLSSQQVANEANYRGSPEEVLATAEISPVEPLAETSKVLSLTNYPAFNWSAAPQLRQSVGGPDNFYFYQILANLNSEWEFTPRLALTGQLAFDVVNNMDSFKYESNSILPHVRSDVKDYLLEGKQSLSRLQLDYLYSPRPQWYTKLSAGYLEWMYAGVGAEVLYQPFGSRLSLGGEVYVVRQREYNQQLGLLDYQVVTGHLSAYYRSPWSESLLKVSVGRYLAGDVGMTLDLSRRFDSGFTMGLYATFTDVSAEEFGEGSFDKGFYINIPFDLLLANSSQHVGTITWQPLSRDGGQKLAPGKPIYELFDRTRQGRLLRDWSSF